MAIRRLSTLLGGLLALAGWTLWLYFERGYDPWVLADASAPPGLEVPNDPRESVLYLSEERLARSRSGARVGLGVTALGGLLLLASRLGRRSAPGGRGS